MEEAVQAALGRLRMDGAGTRTRARKGWGGQMEATKTSKEEDRRLGVGLGYSLAVGAVSRVGSQTLNLADPALSALLEPKSNAGRILSRDTKSPKAPDFY